MAIALDRADIEHVHHSRKLNWAALDSRQETAPGWELGDLGSSSSLELVQAA